MVHPLRRLIHNPEQILAPHVTRGMTVLDIGSAMGFFSLPLAIMVGPQGKVICVDVQEAMLQELQKRARKARLADRIITWVCEPTTLGLEDFYEQIDFALAFAVVHEVPDVAHFFLEVSRLLRPQASCLVAEPKVHVSAGEFAKTLVLAGRQGLNIIGKPEITWSHTALLRKG